MDSKYPHIAFLTYAENFADAASVIVDSEQPTGVQLVMTYLYGHAIELAAKSILLNHGMRSEELKQIGHNLDKCTERAAQYPEGKYFDEELREIVKLLNPVYSGKHLEYHPLDTLLIQLPAEQPMRNTVGKLISSLRKAYMPSRPPQKNM